jgi:hypothetical protein
VAVWREILEPAEGKYLRLSWDDAENKRFRPTSAQRVRAATDLDLALLLADLRMGGLDAVALRVFLNEHRAGA